MTAATKLATSTRACRVDRDACAHRQRSTGAVPGAVAYGFDSSGKLVPEHGGAINGGLPDTPVEVCVEV
jgi:hypothetical protein